MKKCFDDLTIADDFMFCKVMQDEAICKQFLEMILAGQIGKIAYLSPQNSVAAGIEAKSVRLDVFVKDEAGKSYDIEMAFSDRRPCLSENTSFSSEKLAHIQLARRPAGTIRSGTDAAQAEWMRRFDVRRNS